MVVRVLGALCGQSGHPRQILAFVIHGTGSQLMTTVIADCEPAPLSLSLIIRNR
jgi:hypothetical protein